MIRSLRPWRKPLALTACTAMAALGGCAGDNARYACAGYPSRAPMPAAVRHLQSDRRCGSGAGRGDAPERAERRQRAAPGHGLVDRSGSRAATGAMP